MKNFNKKIKNISNFNHNTRNLNKSWYLLNQDLKKLQYKFYRKMPTSQGYKKKLLIQTINKAIIKFLKNFMMKCNKIIKF